MQRKHEMWHAMISPAATMISILVWSVQRCSGAARGVRCCVARRIAQQQQAHCQCARAAPSAPASDLDHPLLAHAPLVARVQPALIVDGFGVLLLDLLHVFRAELGVGHVPHHDVPPTEADLALLRLGRLFDVLRASALGLLVHVLLVHAEDLDLGAGRREAARAPHVRLIERPRRRTRALRHAVHLVDLDAERAKVLERVDGDRRRTGKAELALVEPERKLDLGQHELIRKPMQRRVLARAPKLAVVGVGDALALRERDERLLQALRVCTHRHHLLRDLLPHARHAEEHGRLDAPQPVADRALAQVVRPCEVHREPRLVQCRVDDRADLHREPWTTRWATLDSAGVRCGARQGTASARMATRAPVCEEGWLARSTGRLPQVGTVKRAQRTISTIMPAT